MKKRLFLFKRYFIYFNVNEHAAVSFVELARGGSRVVHLPFFCLYRITYLTISTVAQA